jgi:hypothetical protein
MITPMVQDLTENDDESAITNDRRVAQRDPTLE